MRQAVDAAALRRERSVLLCALADIAILIAYVGIALSSQSLTLLAEAVRGWLMVALELLVLLLMRRIHRGRMAAYEFGAGKLEHFANLLIGLAMAGGAVWLAAGALGKIHLPSSAPNDGVRLALLLSLVNLAVNAAALRALWQAGRDGRSVIMTGQIRTRLSKLLSSAVVVLAIGVAAWAPGSMLSLVADAGGTLFVAVVMLGVAARLWRDSLPDLLDRSLEEEHQALVNRALAAHFAAYEALLSVRSRRAGSRVHVEVALGFAPDRGFAEVAAAMRAVRAELEALIPGAEVVVIPHPV
ncbi:cation diffusion facilitator family transporter [Teichococcus cervicalis]|uniref:Cation diffusion facilitator family transporter n=1 Tax=Pseudoroseomonas cervicalis ATCC 49957 TaxID=525371 RepID=D5RI35_9PROT|nr:cation transporter [Pseudoroseomonas cervicalis]EFH13034.1 cation diffusion facilitator family transporter [Pseudoroseomonas cervicalis ATCC 49957]